MFCILSETLYNLLQLVSISLVQIFVFIEQFPLRIKMLLILHAFLSASSPLVTQDWEQRQEEDNLLIERILLLVRNVLHVPANPSEEKV